MKGGFNKMTLSRKYYKEFALILKQNESKEDIINALMTFFKSDNYRFNEDTFKKAVFDVNN